MWLNNLYKFGVQKICGWEWVLEMRHATCMGSFCQNGARFKLVGISLAIVSKIFFNYPITNCQVWIWHLSDKMKIYKHDAALMFRKFGQIGSNFLVQSNWDLVFEAITNVSPIFNLIVYILKFYRFRCNNPSLYIWVFNSYILSALGEHLFILLTNFYHVFEFNLSILENKSLGFEYCKFDGKSVQVTWVRFYQSR